MDRYTVGHIHGVREQKSARVVEEKSSTTELDLLFLGSPPVVLLGLEKDQCVVCVSCVLLDSSTVYIYRY